MEVDPYPPGDFNSWAQTYDQDVLDENHFPFIGYGRVLKKIAQLAEVEPGMRVLDVGTGTGNLASLFNKLGCQIWASDFSTAMLTQAKSKLPEAKFILVDIRRGWPAAFPGVFDRIVSAYVFHHFTLMEKVHICHDLIGHLTPHGKLIVADIAFSTGESMNEFKAKVMDDWEDENYWLADEAITEFRKAHMQAVFIPISACAGVFVVVKL